MYFHERNQGSVFLLKLRQLHLVALVNLSMSVLRDKDSPHGCPHTGGHCAGTLITRQALSVGASIHKHSHSISMWWEDASPFLFSPDVLGSCCFYDPYRWIKWGVKISGFLFFPQLHHLVAMCIEQEMKRRERGFTRVLRAMYGNFYV